MSNSKITYEQANKAFELAVISLQKNLQHLVDEEKVSTQFISFQNRIIAALINYQHQVEEMIGALEWDIIELSQGKVAAIERLKKTGESLEAICIIHGIVDFPMWLSKGNNYLVQEAIDYYQNNHIALPIVLKKRFDELPPDQKATLDKILFQSHDEEIEAIEKRIRQVKESKR